MNPLEPIRTASQAARAIRWARTIDHNLPAPYRGPEYTEKEETK